MRIVPIHDVARAVAASLTTSFMTRQGQLDLACARCHADNAGRRLRAESRVVRAENLDFGAPEYLALKPYLAWRGEGLPVSSTGVRR